MVGRKEGRKEGLKEGRKEGRKEGTKEPRGRCRKGFYLNPKVINLFNLGQQCNQAGLGCLGPHKAADGHPVLGQHGGMEGNEGLCAARHGPLIWVQEGGAAQLMVVLQHGAGLKTQQP